MLQLGTTGGAFASKRLPAIQFSEPELVTSNVERLGISRAGVGLRATHSDRDQCSRGRVVSTNFGRFRNYLADSNSIFVVAEIISRKKKQFDFFGVLGVRSHAM